MEKLPKNQKYFYDIEIRKAKLNKSAQQYLNPGQDYLPYAIENKHIGSSFDDRYLGPKSSAPTVDNGGTHC